MIKWLNNKTFTFYLIRRKKKTQKKLFQIVLTNQMISENYNQEAIYSEVLENIE